MKDALGLAGRATGVKDEERRFAVHSLGEALGVHLFDFVMPPNVAAGAKLDLVVRAAQDNNFFNGPGEQLTLSVFQRERLVHILLEGDNPAAAKPTIGRDDQLGAR